MNHEISSRVTGFVASFILTMLTYFIILNPDNALFDKKMSVNVIFMLAIGNIRFTTSKAQEDESVHIIIEMVHNPN